MLVSAWSLAEALPPDPPVDDNASVEIICLATQHVCDRMEKLTLHGNLLVEGILLLPPVGGDELIGIGLSLLHAVSASCGMSTRCE